MPAPPWLVLTPWQRQTVVSQVQGIKEDMDILGWRATDEALAERSHARWVRRMEDKGWKRGEEKDPEKKIHPCLVNWKELPYIDQMKTRQAIAIAKVHIGK
jgi:hypothetical protein